MNDDRYHKVARLADLPDAQPVAVTAKGRTLCLVRVDDQVFACEDRCSHAEYPLSEGEIVDDYVIECALHGARFDVRSGAVLEPPATEDLTMYPVRVENGDVYVRLD